MTTVQTMFARATRRVGAALLFATLAALAACETERGVLDPPEVLIAPYDSSHGEALWAVIPLANESGTSLVEADLVADALVGKIDEVRGIACLPLNRSIQAMRSSGIPVVQTPQQARMLANALGVDGVIVGSITAWDPYDPPTIGLKLALFSNDRAPYSGGLDPMRLQAAFTDFNPANRSHFVDRPVATVSEHLDGANHDVLMSLKRYAAGRHDPDSALGWRGILANMGLYTEFAAWWSVSQLLEQERLRLGQPDQAAAEEPR